LVGQREAASMVESWVSLSGGHSRYEVRYGLTSLRALVVSPERLLALVRGQWGIEHGLHYRRDATMYEDHSQLRMGHAPHLLAILNNTVVGLVARQGSTNLAEARREFAYQLEELSPPLLFDRSSVHETDFATALRSEQLLIAGSIKKCYPILKG
jgi:hypothetical protein